MAQRNKTREDSNTIEHIYIIHPSSSPIYLLEERGVFEKKKKKEKRSSISMRLVVRLSYVFVTIKKAMTDFRGLASIQAFTKKKCAQETRNHARISRFFIPRPPPPLTDLYLHRWSKVDDRSSRWIFLLMEWIWFNRRKDWIDFVWSLYATRSSIKNI